MNCLLRTDRRILSHRQCRKLQCCPGIGIADVTFQLPDGQSGEASRGFSQRDPFSSQLWHRCTRSGNRIDHIRCVRLHIDRRVAEICSQSHVVCCHHGIAKLDVHRQEGALIQISHERRGAVASYSGKAVGPGNNRPAPGRRGLVRSEDHAGCSHVRTAGRARVIQNAECRHALGKLIFVELRRTDQLPRLASREWLGSRIEAGEGQEAAKVMAAGLRFSLPLNRFGDGRNRRQSRRHASSDAKPEDPKPGTQRLFPPPRFPRSLFKARSAER